MSAMSAAGLDWHGWRIKGMCLHVGPLPGRKSICLYRLDGSTIKPLAYFPSEDQAYAALEVITAIAEAPSCTALPRRDLAARP
jgi:hypothetical protein